MNQEITLVKVIDPKTYLAKDGTTKNYTTWYLVCGNMKQAIKRAFDKEYFVLGYMPHKTLNRADFNKCFAEYVETDF